MHVRIAPAVFPLIPSVRVGIVWVRGCVNMAASNALAQRVLKEAKQTSINPLLDACALVSEKHRLPVWAADFDRCDGDIQLRIVDDAMNYCDETGVLCERSHWNTADRVRLSDRTLHAVLIVESLQPEDPLEEAMQDLSVMVEDHTGGVCERYVLDSKNKVIELASNRAWEDEE